MVSDEHLNTQVHQSIESIAALRAEWDTLLAGFRTLPRSLLWNGCCPGGVPSAAKTNYGSLLFAMQSRPWWE